MMYALLGVIVVGILIRYAVWPILKEVRDFRIIKEINSGGNSWERNFFLAEKHWRRISISGFADVVRQSIAQQLNSILVQMLMLKGSSVSKVLELLVRIAGYFNERYSLKHVPHETVHRFFAQASNENVFAKRLSEFRGKGNGERVMVASLFFLNTKHSLLFLGRSFRLMEPFKHFFVSSLSTIDLETLPKDWETFTVEQKHAAAKIAAFFDNNDIDKYFRGDDPVSWIRERKIMTDVIAGLTELVLEKNYEPA